jgi:hypothetical protein
VAAGAGLLAVGYFMSIVAAVPGELGSSIAVLFRQVGFFQFVLGFSALVSGVLLYVNVSSAWTWGMLTLCLGLASILSLLLVAAYGTAGVLIFVLPGLLALVAGRSGAKRKAVS